MKHRISPRHQLPILPLASLSITATTTMADIETAFQAAIDAHKINGGVICATNTTGTFKYNNPIGERTLLSGTKQPHQLSDVLFLASATKFITAVAALQCVEDGILSLDGDLSALAPELTSKQVLTGFSDDGTPLFENPSRPITLEHLITHTSGLVYHFMNPAIAQWREENGAPLTDENGEQRRLTVEELFSYPLAFNPGESWMYGPGLDWAGRIVERATGKTLIERMQERLFNPLGINDAQFYPVTREELHGKLVDLNPDDPGAVGRAVLGGNGDMNLRTQGDFGGHGLFMSGESFVKVLQSIMANDAKLLKTETVDGMFQQRLGAEASKGHQDALASPMGIFFRLGIDEETKIGYGLGGVVTLEDVEGWYGERTMTWGGGQTLAWFIDRKNGLCGVGAVLSAVPVDIPTVSDLKQVFRKDVYRKYADWKKRQGV